MGSLKSMIIVVGCAGILVRTDQFPSPRELRVSTVYVRLDSAENEKCIIFPLTETDAITGGGI